MAPGAGGGAARPVLSPGQLEPRFPAQVFNDRPSPFEFFNGSLDAFRRADLQEAVLFLRGAFFENLYIAPLLTGEEYHPQKIRYVGAEGEPRAADEYVRRYRRLWESVPGALQFLGEVWSDPLVRAELRTFISLSKSLLNTESDFQVARLIEERELFLSPERLRRTQSEIISRLTRGELKLPAKKPRLGLILLASRDPVASVEFYRKLLEVEPRSTSRAARGYAEFEFEGVHFAIHGHDRAAATDPYGIGPSPQSFGWGAIFVFAVADLDKYYTSATSSELEIIDSDLSSRGSRFFVVKDPSGYLVEITEEDPKGLETP